MSSKAPSVLDKNLWESLKTILISLSVPKYFNWKVKEFVLTGLKFSTEYIEIVIVFYVASSLHELQNVELCGIRELMVEFW